MKKILLTFVTLLMLITNVFTQNSWEFGLTLPFGTSIGFVNAPVTDGFKNTSLFKNYSYYYDYNTKAGFEWGALLQAGYKMQLKDDLSISILFDGGYHRDVFAHSNSNQKRDNNNNFIPNEKIEIPRSYIMDTIQIGVLPKINIQEKFSFGLGGGIKIPVQIIYTYLGYGNFNGLYDHYEKYGNYCSKESIDRDFKSAIIPYIKATFDYYLPIDTKMSLSFGINMGYDFKTLNSKNIATYTSGSIQKPIFEEFSFSALDIGAQIGLRYVL